MKITANGSLYRDRDRDSKGVGDIVAGDRTYGDSIWDDW
jgi:hypothetical protein